MFSQSGHKNAIGEEEKSGHFQAAFFCSQILCTQFLKAFICIKL